MLKRWLQSAACLFLSLPVLAAANSAPQCQPYSFLQSGFNMSDYNHCKSLIQQCPANGVLPDRSCVNSVVEKNPSCHQLKALSDTIHGSVAAITAIPASTFTIIEQVFTADGQHTYYITSPKGCMVKTNVDPREISATLKKKYQNIRLLTVNWNKLESQTNVDGSQSFTAKLKVTESCLACQIAGWATVRFDFAKNGNLIKTSLVSFDQHNKK